MKQPNAGVTLPRTRRKANQFTFEPLEPRLALTTQPLADFVEADPSVGFVFSSNNIAAIDTVGETETFEVTLDAGQVLSAELRSQSLAGRISLTAPDGSEIAAADATSVGETLLLQAAPIATAGLYSITVSGLLSTTGDFDLDATLNAQVEREEAGGPDNGSAAAAEDLLFTPIGPFPAGEVAVVSGATMTASSSFQTSLTEQNNVFSPNILTYNFSGVPAATGDVTVTFDVLADLGASSEYLIIRFEAENSQNIFVNQSLEMIPGSTSITLPQATFNALRGDGLVSLTVTPTTAVNNLGATELTVTLDYPTPSTSTSGQDWYRLTLDDGQAASFAAVGGAGGIELYEADGATLIASAMSSDGRAAINGFADTSTDGAPQDYFVRVLDGTGSYQLIATRDAELEREPNGDTPQLLSPSAGVLGGLRFGLNGSDSGVTTPIFPAISLFDGTGYLWDLTTNGSVVNGTGDAYDGGQVLVGYPSQGTAESEEAGREISYPAAQVGGLQASRKIYVSPTEGFARYLETFHNNTAQPITQTVTVSSNLGSDGSTALVQTSSGSTTFGVADDWLVTDDADGSGDPTMVHVVAGDGQRPSAASQPGGVITFSYDLTLQPGETQRLLHFAAQNPNRFTAIARANDLAALELGALDGLSPQELDEIVNFDLQTTDDDYYAVQASAGDTISIQTHTPALGPGEFDNQLDIGLEVIGPDGAAVAYTNSPGDELLTIPLAQAGQYTIRAFGEGDTSGVYALDVRGATGLAAPFAVAGSSVAPGDQFLPDGLTGITLNFDDAVRLDSVQATDLLVNGAAVATGVTVLNSQAVRFDLPTLTDGDVVLSLPAGALTSVAGQPVEPFSVSVLVDSDAPRVIASSVLEADALAPGVHSVAISFDDTLDASTIGAEDIQLIGTRVGGQPVSNVLYDAVSGTLTFDTPNLAEDTYTLRLLSGPTGFKNTLGLVLDGEADPATTVPSGDGLPGGDFLVNFQVDVGTLPLPAFARLNPDGAQVYQATATAYLGGAGDVDAFVVNLDAGQTLSLVAEGALQSTVQVTAPDGSVLATESASLAGEPVVLRDLVISAAGDYLIQLSDVGGAAGAVQLTALLNSRIEGERFGGPENSTAATAEALVFQPLGPGGGEFANISGYSSSQGPLFTQSATQSGLIYYPNTTNYTLTGLPAPTGPGVLRLDAVADLDLSSEFLSLVAEGIGLGSAFVSGGAQMSPVSTSINLPFATLQALAADGVFSLNVTPSSSVNNLGATSLTATLSYPTASGDGDDWFRLPLGDGQSSTVAFVGGAVEAELYEPDGTTLIATARSASNLTGVIENFVDSTTDGGVDEYLIRVRSVGTGDYQLLVTRDAVFDIEPNEGSDQAQSMAGGAAALGYVSGPVAFGGGPDWYSLPVSAGDVVTLGVSTPAAGPGEFDNPLANGLPGGLIISEVVDGDTLNGNPNFVELTNTTSTPYTFSDGGLIVQTNSNTDRNIDVDLTGVTIGAGESFVIASASNEGQAAFEGVYGFAADLYADEIIGDGNDRYALSDGGVVLDVFGVLDVNGAGQGWEYTNSYAHRVVAAIAPAGEAFASAEWLIAPLNALNDGVESPDVLLQTLTTPGSHSFVPAGTPLARVAVYGPDGALIEGDAQSLTFTAATDGLYKVEVSALAASGEYVLSASGATGADLKPGVVSVTPSDGVTINGFPQTVTVQFSEALRDGEVTAADLTVNGVAAVSVAQLDALTFRFTTDPAAQSGDGDYQIEVAGGAVTDLQGQTNDLFASTFTVDTTGPRVVDTLIDSAPLPFGVTFAPGDKSIEVVFDEDVNGDTITASSVVLTEQVSGVTFTPIGVAYDAPTRTLTVDYTSLGEGAYEFRLDGAVRTPIVDGVGNRLDGEPVGPGLGGIPSGDGVPGGDYFFEFQVDSVGLGAIGEFTRLEPYGGLIFASENNPGLLNQPGDVDDYELDLVAGETIGVVVTPTDPTSTLSVAIVGLAGLVTAPGPGEPVVLPAVASPADGPATLRVIGDVPTPYLVDVFLNAALETAAGDSSAASPLPIDSSALALPETRLAVLGQTQPTVSTFDAYTEGFEGGLNGFSLSGQGLWSLSTGRQLDGLPGHSAPNSLYFGKDATPFGGGDYDTGAAVAGTAVSPFITLPDTGWASLSFSHLIETDRVSDLAEVVVLANSTSTTVLSTADGSLTPDSNGQWQTAVADLSAFSGESIRLQFVFDTVDAQDNDLEGWYVDDLRIEAAGASIADSDEYVFTAAAGVPLDIVLAGHDAPLSTDGYLQVFDPVTGQVLANGSSAPLSADAANYDLGVLGYVPAASGELGVRVVSESPGRYGLVVLESLRFEAEPNNSAEGPNLVRLLPGEGALGFLGSGESAGAEWLWGVQPSSGMIVRISPGTGNVVEAFAAPGDLQPFHRNIGLTMAEGGNVLLYQNSNSATPGTLYRIDPETGSVLSTHAGDSSGPDGLSYQSVVGGVASLFHSHRSADLHRQVGYGGGSNFGWGPGAPIGGVGGDDNGRLFAAYTDGMIHEVDPYVDRTTFLSGFPVPAAGVEGLAFDGEHLYASTDSGELFVMNPDTGAVLGQVTVSGGAIFGLGVEPSGGVTPEPGGGGGSGGGGRGLAASEAAGGQTLPAAAYTALLPEGVEVADLAAQLAQAAAAAPAGAATAPSDLAKSDLAPVSLIVTSESEPNNTQATANPLPLGFGDGQDAAIDVNGDLLGDADMFRVSLQPGDILGVNLNGATTVELYDSTGALLIGSNQDLTFIHPASSPLPGGGSALSRVIDTAGDYYLSVSGGFGAYVMNLRLFRPVLEAELAGTRQTLFLDFDGATIDTSIFGGFGTATLSPLSAYLGGWGLTAADEDAVIDAIIASVEESLADDVRSRGLNGDFAGGGPLGSFDVEILNSRDHADPFGAEHVSRVIVGGSISQLGISTIGIAETIDVGNFDTSESAVVLLDLLSAAGSNPNSLNQFSRDPSVSIIDMVGVGVGNIVVHEAGHIFGNWHTSNSNAVADISDQGGNLANTIGLVGGVYGDGDDRDSDLGADVYASNEGFTGLQNTMSTVAFGLSTGARDPQLVGPRVLSFSPEAGVTNDLNLSSIEVEFSEQLDASTAVDPANYLLLEAGPDGLFQDGGGDDVVIPVTPSYDGGVMVSLATPSNLSPGIYQLTLDGESSLLDLDGNPLNSLQGPGTGSNTVHEFEVVLQLPEGGDVYQLWLAAGEGVVVETRLPLDSTAGPENLLDAELSVYGPDGALIGFDQDSGEGQNAALPFIAAVEGWHTIRVSAESPEQGEYLLNATPANLILAGDFNRDGSVDLADYTVWRDQKDQEVPAYAAADGDGDGLIGASDYQVWIQNYGVSYATATALNLIEIAAPAPAAEAEAPAPTAVALAEPVEVGVASPTPASVAAAPARTPAASLSGVFFVDSQERAAVAPRRPDAAFDRFEDLSAAGDDLLLLLAQDQRDAPQRPAYDLPLADSPVDAEDAAETASAEAFESAFAAL